LYNLETILHQFFIFKNYYHLFFCHKNPNFRIMAQNVVFSKNKFYHLFFIIFLIIKNNQKIKLCNFIF